MSSPSRLLRRLSAGVTAFAGRLRRDQRGAIAVQFALLAIPLAVLVFAMVDLGRISLQRRQMQDALDAATLMAARSTASTDADLEAVGDPAFLAEVAGLNLGLTASNASFKMGTDNHVIGAATATLQPIIANLWTKGGITITATSDVVRSSKNLEVSLVLDITASMSGSRISDLKTAAASLVDIVVKDAQTPFYSKVALVPYAAGVNVNPYADAIRGAVPVRAISGAKWNAGSTFTISAISKASTAEVTTTASHGLTAGDPIYLTGIKGMTQIGTGIYTVGSVTSSTKFTLSGVKSTNYSTYTANSGSVTECLASTCDIVVTTSAAHGFITGDLIDFASMSGLTSLNGTTKTITKLTTTTFDTSLFGPGLSTYTSGGTATCNTSTNPGCQNYTFTNVKNTQRTFGLSPCVSERIGSEAYTDAAPSTAFVGRNYPPPSTSGNDCPDSTITPLSSDRTVLKNQINGMQIAGSTAGQIGLAWGWYMVSPNFGYLWPNDTQKPAAYNAKDLMKVVILMTDGAFNTPYCNGVISSDAGSGSGSDTDHINCAATNSDSFTQANALCKAIKTPANNVILYTVGFTVDATAKTFLTNCATDAAHAYFPTTGSDLQTAFKAIAQEISNLRIAK